MGQTADKLKIIAPMECVEWRPNCPIIRGEDFGLPYHLYFKRDAIRRTYTIEFSGKILGDRYPELISPDTIRLCFETINALGFCCIDIDRILAEAEVVSMDFTKDIALSDIPNVTDMRDLQAVTNLSIDNYRRWTCQRYQGNGIVITNIVKDKRYERRLTIYDKEHELSLSTNRPFIRSLSEPERVLDYFRGKVRFELRATRKQQIRRWLNIDSLSLRNVLECETNPLEAVMSEMFTPINVIAEAEVSRYSTLDRLSTCKLYDWDLARIEAHVRVNRPQQWRRDMVKYRELYAMHHELSQPMNLINVVRS